MKGKIVKINDVKAQIRVICASGTPVPESPTFAYPFIRICKDGQIIPTKRRFNSHFLVRAPRWLHVPKRGRIKIMKTVGFRNLSDLKQILQYHSIRRLQDEVEGMPEKVFVYQEAVMTKEQRELYNGIRNGLVEEIEGLARDISLLEITNKTLRLRQVLNHPELVGAGGESGKYLLLDDILEEILSNPDSKVVVWTNWLTAIELLVERYQEYNAKPICGNTPQKDIEDLQENFDTNDVRVIVATPDKAGTGIDFLQRARFAVYVERHFSSVLDSQSTDRIQRRGAQGASVIIRIVVPETMDDFTEFLLEEKLGRSEALVTDDETLIRVGKSELLRFLR